jgi:hypothetical protein
VPRKAESLCSLVRSTPILVAFSGIFTVEPVEEVSVIVFMSTMKERRLVLGGGLSGVALNVTLRVAVPPPPQFAVQGVFKPLHEVKETADSKSSEAKTFRKFTRPPRQSRRAYGGQGTHIPHAILSPASKVMDVKGMQIVQPLNTRAGNPIAQKGRSRARH